LPFEGLSMRQCGALQALVSFPEDPLDPETQAGTDQLDPKEQARQAMLRASQVEHESTDADVEDDETDEVADQPADEDAPPDEDDDADADEADDESDDEDDADESEETDSDSADVAEAGSSDGKKRKRKPGKVAKLYEKIERLEAQLAEQGTTVSAEVERVLAEKAQADEALAAIRAEQDEDGKRIKQVRDYVHRLRGTDQERDALVRELASVDDLDPLAITKEQRDEIKGKRARLNQILSARDVVDIATEYADADLKDRVSGILAEFAKTLPGVDRDFHTKLAFVPAIQHVYDSAYARGTSESAAAIAKHEKTIADLEGKLSAAKLQKRAPMARVADGGSPVKPAPKPKPLDQMSPQERIQSMGMIGKDGRIDPEFRRKKALGLIKLVG
jgi:hypothetical protein